jgi:hypothetical protein
MAKHLHKYTLTNTVTHIQKDRNTHRDKDRDRDTERHTDSPKLAKATLSSSFSKTFGKICKTCDHNLYYFSLDHNHRRVEFSFIFYERSLMILRIECTSALTLVYTRVDCSGCTNKSAHTCQHDVDVCMSMHVQSYPAQKTHLMLLNYRYKYKLGDARVNCSGCSEKTAYNCNCEHDINRKCYLSKNMPADHRGKQNLQWTHHL